ncbi:hypothetical protein DFP72DRAFT_473499 [Ephemerocybe angulata]|uniref:DUF6699 domain-containing protein n=1 Tax=Ephemerocybe angulata TaxID=980116 RepID=A0A8H6HSU7_9AGAR|nr:hypothetical protein DFP72DRAFT_473499 [Tulosesus angulatus]
MRTKQITCSPASSDPAVNNAVDAAYTPAPSGWKTTTEAYLTTPMSTWSQPTTSGPSTPLYTLPSPSNTPLPSSPPPLNHSRSPYANVPLPPVLPYQEGEPIVHPVLERGPTSLAMHWDVRTSPSAALSSISSLLRHRQHPRDRREPRPQDWQYQAATFPALDSIVIRTAAIPDRPLVVFPTSTKHGFVTVYDVLNAVHRAVCPPHVEVGDELFRLPNKEVGASGRAARAGERLRACRTGSDRSGLHSHGWLWGGLTPSPTEGGRMDPTPLLKS